MKKFIYGIFIIVLLFSFSSCKHGNFNNKNNELTFFKEVSRESRNIKLKEDLDYYEKVMLEKHQKEYRNITDEDFKNKINELKLKIDNISDSEFMVEIQRIMSYFKEGHLSFRKMNQAILPFFVQTFEDGTYIIGTEKDYKDYNFSKIISINGIKIEDIRNRVKEIVSGDNKYNIDYWIDNYIVNLDYLVGLKIISDVNKIDILLEKDKKLHNVNFKAKISRNITVEETDDSYYEKFKDDMKKEVLKLIENSNLIDKEELKTELKYLDNINFKSYNYIGNSFLEIDNIPYKMNPIEYYSFETFPKSKAMVLHYNKCFNNENKPFDKFSYDFFNYIRNNKDLLKINNIIIDLRYNEGGSELYFQYFIEELKKYENENKSLKIHILVGRDTFSSGAGAVYSLIKYFKDVKIYGYPLAGGIKASGDVIQDILPNSKLIFTYGQKFFDITKDNKNSFSDKEINENTILPYKNIKPKIKDYIDNRDYVLQELLDYIKEK